MSDANVASVREAYLALNRGDTEGLVRMSDPDVTYDVSRRTFDPLVYHGHEGIRAAMALMAEQWEVLRVEPQDFVTAGDEVVVPVRLIGVGRQSGVETKANAAHVWRFRNGTVVRLTIFQTLDEAREAAGLPLS